MLKWTFVRSLRWSGFGDSGNVDIWLNISTFEALLIMIIALCVLYVCKLDPLTRNPAERLAVGEWDCILSGEVRSVDQICRIIVISYLGQMPVRFLIWSVPFDLLRIRIESELMYLTYKR